MEKPKIRRLIRKNDKGVSLILKENLFNKMINKFYGNTIEKNFKKIQKSEKESQKESQILLMEIIQNNLEREKQNRNRISNKNIPKEYQDQNLVYF